MKVRNLKKRYVGRFKPPRTLVITFPDHISPQTHQLMQEWVNGVVEWANTVPQIEVARLPVPKCRYRHELATAKLHGLPKPEKFTEIYRTTP